MLSEGLKIVSALKDYIDFLKANDGRIMITPWDVKMLEKIKHNIQSHKLARLLLSPVGDSIDLNGNITTSLYHEFHINWSWMHVECKSLLDGLTFDFKEKKVIIYDLKTTQKLWHFEDSINTYDYLRQLCYYTMATHWYLEEELKQNPKDWSHEWYIIGIDTTGSNDIRVFKLTEDQIWSRYGDICTALDDIKWHQTTGKWDHSREYYEGDGSESLNL